METPTIHPVGEQNKQRLSLTDYLKLQQKEMLGPNNIWLAGEKLGHSPSPDEAAHHYIDNGGAVDFNRRHGHLLEDEEDEEDY